MKLTIQDVEDFVREAGNRVGRRHLKNIIAHLRSFLRYLAVQNEVPIGLDSQIDTPCVYRGEQLPRALAWETVLAFLQSIDRSIAIGKRDYAMLLCMATYGLRSSEVVSLKLEDIEWRFNRIKVFQRKTGKSLVLPLTDAVGDSIINYLQEGRPLTSNREIFVRHRAPAGILKPKIMHDIFQAWRKRSGLDIPPQGPHCLRHSFATHLLRQGVSLKTIGDILGHRDFESTCVYLRLNIDELRTVALNLPVSPNSTQEVLS